MSERQGLASAGLGQLAGPRTLPNMALLGDCSWALKFMTVHTSESINPGGAESLPAVNSQDLRPEYQHPFPAGKLPKDIQS